MRKKKQYSSDQVRSAYHSGAIAGFDDALRILNPLLPKSIRKQFMPRKGKRHAAMKRMF